MLTKPVVTSIFTTTKEEEEEEESIEEAPCLKLPILWIPVKLFKKIGIRQMGRPNRAPHKIFTIVSYRYKTRTIFTPFI